MHLAQLWQYPVKSMIGSEVSAARLGPDGMEGDRTWATRDEERGGIRGLINLWAGTAPTGFSLVGEQHHKQGLMRRYRATYPDRVEHVLVGFTQQRQIYWAWPL